MEKSNQIVVIKSYFNEILHNPKCELNYNKDYELVIAVMLSAQTTDKKVNEVTDVLFKKYPTLDDFNKASLKEIENNIKEIGLYKNKAIALKDIVFKLINNFNYKVPNNKEDLLSMRGVGNKVANVVLIELFDMPEFPVDTHVYRVSKRLGLIKNSDSVEKCEEKLRKLFKKDEYKLLHHQFIHFGRYHCKAIKPNCEACKLKEICKEYALKK